MATPEEGVDLVRNGAVNAYITEIGILKYYASLVRPVWNPWMSAAIPHQPARDEAFARALLTQSSVPDHQQGCLPGVQEAVNAFTLWPTNLLPCHIWHLQQVIFTIAGAVRQTSCRAERLWPGRDLHRAAPAQLDHPQHQQGHREAARGVHPQDNQA